MGVSVMTTWTNVSSTVLEPGDPIRSVDIIAIKENTVYNYENTTAVLLNTQIFTESGTWNKPAGFDATDSVIFVAIGGGGSGGAARNAGTGTWAACGGGGGGGVAIGAMRYADIGSSITVTVGAGGAARSAPNAQNFANGLAGGTSSFGVLAQATGGGGGDGATQSGDQLFVNGGVAGQQRTFYLGNPTVTTFDDSVSGFGRAATSTTSTYQISSGLTGGGGGAGLNVSTVRTQNYVAGTGRIFGDGGAGNASANGSNGSIPGGGGGGCCRTVSATSGAGARGEVRVYVVRGAISAETFFGFNFRG